MEYKTYGDRAVKLEKWPISSFGMSISQSVTVVSARDASASENYLCLLDLDALKCCNPERKQLVVLVI